MDIIERQKKRCYICFGYGHDPDDCLLNCEKELDDLIPERHSAKLDRELEALQAKHDELVELVEKYVNAYDALKYEFHHGNVHSHSRANHKHDGCLAALRKAVGKD
jgi:hypothetical protein